MARAVLERELTGSRKARVQFAVAERADDPEIRRLLRENPIPGRISISLEREPSYFADADLPGETKQTVVARENGRVVCLGHCTIRQRFVNGTSRRVGYLGGLRLDSRQAGRFNILRRGYEFFHLLQRDAPADFYFTSISADNERARNLLERGLPGMPRYEFIGEFVTAFLPAARRTPVRREPQSHAPIGAELIPHFNEHNRHCQLAPAWTAKDIVALKSLGLDEQDFCFERTSGQITGFAALWDQRRFRQAVVRDYAPWLKLARPLLNLAARLIGTPHLPAVGRTLPNAFASHLAGRTERPETLTAVVNELRALAKRRGIGLLTMGFAANDPRLALLRKHFRSREYRSRLYIVRWPKVGGAAGDLDGRVLAPEVALL